MEQIKSYVKHRQILQNMKDEKEARLQLAISANENKAYLKTKKLLNEFKEKSREF